MILGILSDIHSDRTSLLQALSELRAKNCDRLVCLGDIVGFSHHYEGKLEDRDGEECIRIVRANCDYVIAGNHDLHAAGKMPSLFRELGYPESWCQLEERERKRISGDTAWLYDDEYPEEYSPSSVNYLSSLQETMMIGEGKIYLSHYLYPDITGSTKYAPSRHEDFNPHLTLLREKKASIGIMGHKHPEGYVAVTEKQAGVYGFRSNPLEDFPVVLIIPAITGGSVRNGYLVLDTSSGTIQAFPLGRFS